MIYQVFGRITFEVITRENLMYGFYPIFIQYFGIFRPNIGKTFVNRNKLSY